jgi:cell division protein FtsI/penicillin-binding protein 2
MITAAAALERGGLSTHEPVRFRGSDYLLSRWNYLPNSKLDRRVMDLSTALGKSCNPVFARVALQNLDTPILERYAVNFGFNSEIPFDINVQTSRFNLEGDNYDLARTAAGFGEVSISPLHAALITAAIANSGKMMKPYVVDRIVAADGKLEYQAQSSSLRYPILSSTAQQLLEMMKETVESGTAKKHFTKLRKSTFRDIEVAAKTGTLSGDNPKGMYYWFVAAAPADEPEIAIAVLVIDTGGGRVRGTSLGKELLEHYFTHRPDPAPALPSVPEPVPQVQVRSTQTQ